MKLVNLTPHAITYQHANGTRTTIPASGTVARLKTESRYSYYFLPVPQNALSAERGDFHHPDTSFDVWITTVGQVENLPKTETETIYIVSMPVAQSVWRSDVVAPDSGASCIRDGKGQIEAVTRFVRYMPAHVAVRDLAEAETKRAAPAAGFSRTPSPELYE